MPDLEPGEVHLWEIDLLAAPDEIARLGSLLDAGERGRAGRYHFDRHRRRYIVGQGSLRVLLGRYGAAPPETLVFEQGPKGKPSLLGPHELHFNVSNSDERSVVAVARDGPLGVDIERLRSLADADEIAGRFFSEREAADYASLPAAERPRAFFDCWTRKEAFIKALGEGLFLSLDRFDVSLRPDRPARLERIDGDEAKAREWSLTELRFDDDFAGALAAPWTPRSIRAWRVPVGELLAQRRAD
jgi:4'-phosphopantetheinyl transferase